MALYLGSEMVKINLNVTAYYLNLFSENSITNGIRLLSSDGYVLKDGSCLKPAILDGLLSVCPEGYLLREGACLKLAAGENLQCSEGYQFMDGFCVRVVSPEVDENASEVLQNREASTENPRLSLLNLTLFYRNRAILYDRIDRRVEQMMREGLLEETERLYRTGRLVPGTTAAAAIGYKECLGAVTGEMTAEEAVETLKNATHHYAKRQETWFSAHPHLPLYADDENGMRPFEEVLAEAKAQVLSFLKA